MFLFALPHGEPSTAPSGHRQFLSAWVRCGRLLMIFPLIWNNLFPQVALAAAEAIPGGATNILFVRDETLNDTVTRASSSEPKQLQSSERIGTRFMVFVSAYSSSVNQTDATPFRTASGTYVGREIIAANFLPIGTLVSIEGKDYRVEDRLSDRYNGTLRVDMWKPTRAEAIQFGVRKLELTVLALPSSENN